MSDSIDWKTLREAYESIPYLKTLCEPYPEGAFCCIQTGEIMLDLGKQYSILMRARGGLSSVPGMSQVWWMYVPKVVWDSYLKFCEKQGYPRGEGPFQWNARSLPIKAGGTGAFSDIQRVGEIMEEPT